MEFPKVQPANRAGGWELEGVGYRRQAHLCLHSFEQKAALLHKHVDRLEEARKTGGTYKIPRNLLEKYRFFRSAAVIFSAMAVEGFLNYYGVLRLGEDFYRDTYERLSSYRKLAAVVASCTGQLMPSDAELAVVLRRLNERRNALVHPKAREVKPRAGDAKARRSLPPVPPVPPNPAADSVRDMNGFSSCLPSSTHRPRAQCPGDSRTAFVSMRGHLDRSRDAGNGLVILCAVKRAVYEGLEPALPLCLPQLNLNRYSWLRRSDWNSTKKTLRESQTAVVSPHARPFSPEGRGHPTRHKNECEERGFRRN